MRRPSQRGSHAIEFAMLMPVFLLFVGGIFDYGRYFYQLSSLEFATQMGCRAASVIDPGINRTEMLVVEARAEQIMEDWLYDSAVDPTRASMTVVQSYDVPTWSIVCSADMPFQNIFPMIPTPAVVEASTVILMEYQR